MTRLTTITPPHTSSLTATHFPLFHSLFNLDLIPEIKPLTVPNIFFPPIHLHTLLCSLLQPTKRLPWTNSPCLCSHSQISRILAVHFVQICLPLSLSSFSSALCQSARENPSDSHITLANGFRSTCCTSSTISETLSFLALFELLDQLPFLLLGLSEGAHQRCETN